MRRGCRREARWEPAPIDRGISGEIQHRVRSTAEIDMVATGHLHDPHARAGAVIDNARAPSFTAPMRGSRRSVAAIVAEAKETTTKKSQGKRFPT
jgi:hypothetical protein